MGNRNLIRFDWAIKRLLRNKADFKVLEGFLSELLKEDVLIQEVIESEGNQEKEDDKFNRVDILVKNIKDELVIIEIQNQKEFDYFQHMLYGTSKVITKHISISDAYVKVKKVFSINVVYFDLGQGDDYVYHGYTEFTGIHNHDKLQLSENQTKLLGGKTPPSQIFPEYYVLKVNKFDDVAKDTLDEWIYYLKNGEIKPEFTAKGISEARKLWRVDMLPEAEQKKYFRHIEDLHYKASMALTWKIEEDTIREDERTKTNLAIAESMKNKGISTQIISDITGLSY